MRAPKLRYLEPKTKKKSEGDVKSQNTPDIKSSHRVGIDRWVELGLTFAGLVLTALTYFKER